ncbi:MAG TPA: hypothetical protein V6D26_30715 [Stenomitos sp.]
METVASAIAIILFLWKLDKRIDHVESDVRDLKKAFGLNKRKGEDSELN